MKNPVTLFFRRSRLERALFLEAFRALAWAKLRVYGIPFRKLAPTLGRAQTETSQTIVAADRSVAAKVSWAVQCAARYVPLGFVCLPQAIAAQRMLRRRRIASTLYLGVASNREKKDAIVAHAWLRAGDKIVTGEIEARRHRALAWFGDEPASP